MGRLITALKVQKRNPNRVNVFLDGKYAFGLARIVAAWLQVGQVLSEEKIATLQDKDVEEVAFQKAVKYLGYRPRSEAEVRRNLTMHGFSEQLVNETVERLRRNGLTGDEQFARAWVENRTTFRPRSQRALMMELKQKGVNEEIVQNVMDETVDDESLAYQVAVRRLRHFADLDYKEYKKKLSGYLLRRGFSYETIKPVVDRTWLEVRKIGSETEVMDSQIKSGNEEFNK